MISGNSPAKSPFEQRIVICGSMSFFADMVARKRDLDIRGIPSLLPDPDTPALPNTSLKNVAELKRQASVAHLRRIRDPRTHGILVVNRDKHDIYDYIGPNTFAEIAIAFAQNKRIYIDQSFPAAYEAELESWRAIPLLGVLDQMVSEFRTSYTNTSLCLPLCFDAE